MSANALMKEPPEAAPLVPTFPQVSPEDVTTEFSGETCRRLTIWLPQGLTADSAAKEQIWKRVQASGKALIELDDLRMIAHDRSWLMETTVAYADAQTVILFKPKGITQWPERPRPYARNAGHSVYQSKHLFAVKRDSDGARVTGFTTTEADAERDLRNLEPRVLTR